MKRYYQILSLYLLALAGFPFSNLYAQAPARRLPPPTVSPYLNLLRRGAGPGFNYFTLVRPELELRSAVRQMQTNIGELRRQQEILQQQETMPATGHPTYFMNTGWYFNVGPRQGPALSPPGTPFSPTRRVFIPRYR